MDLHNFVTRLYAHMYVDPPSMLGSWNSFVDTVGIG